MPGLPTYYYVAIAGVLLLVVLLLIKRSAKSKETTSHEGLVGGFPVAEGWAAAGIWVPTAETDAPTATEPPADESKRAARARTRREAKAAAKASMAPVATGSHAEATTSIKGHRRKKGRAARRAGEVEVVPAAPADAPATLIEEDGWLTTPAPVETLEAMPVGSQPVDLFQVANPYQPAAAFDVPQQFSPLSPPAPQYAMAGAPAALAEAAAAIAASTPQASQSPFAEAAGAADAPEVGATSASFTELVGSAPEPPAAEPVVPDLPLGPYTFGARTIVPGKR